MKDVRNILKQTTVEATELEERLRKERVARAMEQERQRIREEYLAFERTVVAMEMAPTIERREQLKDLAREEIEKVKKKGLGPKDFDVDYGEVVYEYLADLYDMDIGDIFDLWFGYDPDATV